MDTDGDDQPDAKQTEKHEDPEDSSQTVVVNKTHESPKGNLATTVSADGKQASVDEPVRVTTAQAAAGVTVVDTISYTGLAAGEYYEVSGSLFEVKDGVTVGDAKATATARLTASDTGEGEWSLDFGKVTGLEPGKQYVVFETATSVNDLVDTDGDDQPDAKQTEKHEDPEDSSQTVVVDLPKKPEMPETGMSGVGILLGSALLACLAGAGIRAGVRKRS